MLPLIIHVAKFLLVMQILSLYKSIVELLEDCVLDKVMNTTFTFIHIGLS